MPTLTRAVICEALQWPGMVLGLIGAVLIGYVDARLGFAGFVCFLLSNVCWIAWGLHRGGRGLVIMQSLFVITSLMGMYHKWLAIGAA